MTEQHHRIYTFDLLRGFAVLAMMLAHSVYFFHSRDSDFLLSVEGFGNTVSFVTFLLVSGAVTATTYFHTNQGKVSPKRKKIFSRMIVLLVSYYILAIVLTGAEFLQAEGFSRIRLIIDILTFRLLPGFTEYFPPFIFYSALLVAVPRFFTTASRTLKHLIFVSLLSLLAGWALYQVPVSEYLRPWVALLSGAEGLYRFPLLQYLPVFLFGMYWGHRTLSSDNLRAKGLSSWRYFSFFTLIVLIAGGGSYLFDLSLASTFLRWPPTVPFLALGLACAFLVVSLLYAGRQLRRLPLLRDLLLLFGQNALGLFWSHIFLLGLYAAGGGPQVSSAWIFLFLFLLLTLVSLALTTFLPFNFRFALTASRGSREEREEEMSQEAVIRLSKDVANDAVLTSQGIRNYFFPNPRTTSRRTLRKRHKLGIALALLAASAFVFPETVQEIAYQRQLQEAGVWWSNDYAYRQQLSLRHTETFVSISKGTVISLPFNHQELVDQGKSRSDGRDIKLVYWSGDEHLVAEGYIANPTSQQAAFTFRAPVQIRASKEELFYSLYYGGFVSDQAPAAKLEPTATVVPRFSQEESYPLVLSVTNSWSLIGRSDGSAVTIHLTTADKSDTQSVAYRVLDTDLTGALSRSADNTWEADIPVGPLPPGAYRVQATLTDGANTQASQITGFYRTHPLYVAWTFDWEGYDASQAYLGAMETIADQYQLPMTHFFSPRVFVTETVAPARARTLAQWVQRRIERGDGYGLHLHMMTDFVKQVGIEPKADPNWGDRGDGYGVPLSTYSKDEQARMIQYANDLLFKNGLPKTTFFRAGGWFANLDTLAALEELEFTVDSSARTTYQFGRNQLKGLWNVSPTARPYYPSRTNQNRSSGTNDFNILEIPNNGADSYAFNAAEMIERFTKNFGQGLLKEPQQITYLSHPHWFDDKEQARVRELLAYISQYTYSNNRGPVIFTTTAEIANIWSDE